MRIKASSLKIVVAIGLIVTGIQIQLVFGARNSFQQQRAEAAKRSAAEITASGAETPTAFGGLKKEDNQ